MALELKIMRGLPASGKTTLARRWVAEDPRHRARLNRDELRKTMHDGVFLGRDTEKQIIRVEDTALEALLQAGISVVVDDTNLPQSRARDLARIGRKHGALVRAWDLTDVMLELCLERDRARIREGRPGVGDEVILGMHERFLKGRETPLPQPRDDEDAEPAYVYVPDDSLPPAWLVDLDGTLALMRDRGPFDWHLVGGDALNEPVAEIARALSVPLTRGYPRIVILSGRDECCRSETEEWLELHGVSCHTLLMRPEGDMRKDAIVKLELFRNHVAPYYCVRGVIDDRQQVVDMWRSIGLTCAQVAPGAF